MRSILFGPGDSSERDSDVAKVVIGLQKNSSLELKCAQGGEDFRSSGDCDGQQAHRLATAEKRAADNQL